MKVVFIFFLRLFFCFVGAKLLLRLLGLDLQPYLIGLTVILLVNIYWFDYLEYRDRIAFRLPQPERPPPETAPPGAEAPSAENAPEA
ncbi:MAG: hypothetical protein AB1424_03400 [Thermodesulfobacteriota bacterium]